MKPRRLFLSALCGLALASFPLDASEEKLSWKPFGAITLYHREARPANVVLFISGDGGWNLGVVDMARELAQLDAAVAGFSITDYLKASASPKTCFDMASDLEGLARFVERHLGYTEYVRPVLVGYSSGATMAYASLVQAKPGVFRGALSLGFCPDLALHMPICTGNGLAWETMAKGQGVNFLPTKTLLDPWIAFQGTIDQVCSSDSTIAYVKKVTHGEIVSLPHVGHGFSVPKNWLPQFKASFARLTRAAAAGAAAPPPDPTNSAPPPPRPPAQPSAPAPVPTVQPAPARAPRAPRAPIAKPDLPLIEVAARGPQRPVLAVLLSGDGGWATPDKGISDGLADAGIPVVGWNALRYFWKARSPPEAAADLAGVLRYYLGTWGRETAIVIGYSFGADVMPFLIARLPPDLRQRIALVVLIGPASRAQFEFHAAEWFGRAAANGVDVRPEIEKLRGLGLLCLYGSDEGASLCKELPADLATVVVRPGSHRVGHDYAPVVSAILSSLPPEHAASRLTSAAILASP